MNNAQRLSREWIETHPQRTGATEGFVIAKLARERAGELVQLAEALEG